MSRESLTYAVVTPARNEAENLGRLADSLAAQTELPAVWLLVDNGSTDDTPEVAAAFAAEHPWARYLHVPGEASPTRGGPVAQAFATGVAALDEPVDVVVKVDADISFDPDHFERLLERLAADPSLGIAGSTCYELEDGEWKPQHVTGNRVRGAVRAYRQQCFQDVLPLENRPGWDGIDEMRAAARGWRSAGFTDLAFRHHRPVGRRDESRWRRLFDVGRAAHYAGYRPTYLVMRSLFKARKELAWLAAMAGYAAAAVRREPRCEDELARDYLRRQQALRAVPTRALEALGRRSS
jgi:glycosyltransferase involved in cell wall biosynthesis